MFLIATYLCHYACCCGDTWASELGSLSKAAPRLIIPPFRSVPTGTNGGVSTLGFLASGLGGALIGCIYGLSNDVLLVIFAGMFLLSFIFSICHPLMFVVLSHIFGANLHNFITYRTKVGEYHPKYRILDQLLCSIWPHRFYY